MSRGGRPRLPTLLISRASGKERRGTSSEAIIGAFSTQKGRRGIGAPTEVVPKKNKKNKNKKNKAAAATTPGAFHNPAAKKQKKKKADDDESPSRTLLPLKPVGRGRGRTLPSWLSSRTAPPPPAAAAAAM
jgi:hypothetical protein